MIITVTDSLDGVTAEAEGVSITVFEGSATTGGGGGVTDHGALTGLADDDHALYHTDARGDARYDALGDADAAQAAAEATAATALTTHAADTTSVHGIADTAALATDAEVTSAISTHEGLSDPHPGYLTTAEGAAAYQPVDSDLTAIAALTTTAYGRSLLEAANAAGLRTLGGLVLGTDIYSKAAVDSGFQPLDSDLTAIAALTTTSYGRALLAAADLAALQAILGTTGTPSATTYLRGDGSWSTPSGGSSALPKVVELSSNLSATTGTYTTRLSTTFVPTGTAIRVSMAAALNVTSGEAQFRAVRDDGAGGAGASAPFGGIAVITRGSFAGARKFTGLTAGLTYAIDLQHRQDGGAGTLNIRPASFPDNEELTMTVEDCT